jgi:hypothetical protein
MNESKACCSGELSHAPNLTKNRNMCRQHQSKDDSLGQLLHGSILGNIQLFTLLIIIHAFNTQIFFYLLLFNYFYFLY